MKRRHWFEIADLEKCPTTLGQAMHEAMAAVPASVATILAGPLVDTLKRTGSPRVLDLCSGAGGPWQHLAHAISDAGLDVDVELSDVAPPPSGTVKLPVTSRVSVSYSRDPIDAREPQESRTGFRTVFNAIHHLRPHEVQAFFGGCADAREGILISEITSRRPSNLIWNLLAMPLVTFLGAAFTGNARIIAWTYLGGILPMAIGWDGVVSCLRSHTPEELVELGRETAPDYEWTTGVTRVGKLPVWVNHVIGVPRSNPTVG